MPYAAPCGVSDSTGAYVVASLPPGDYSVLFSHPSFVEEWYDDATGDNPTLVTVAEGAATAGVNAALVPLAEPGSISGTVSGASGPLEGVSVCARHLETSASSLHQHRRRRELRPGGPSPGDYEVFFDGTFAGYSAEYYDNALDAEDATPVTVVEGSDTPDIDAVLIAGGAHITFGRTEIGLNKEGDLNYVDTGLAFDGQDGIFPGCLCEAWGAGDATTLASGSSGRVSGIDNVEVESFSSTASTAVSTTIIKDDAGEPLLRVTHDYHPSDAANVFEVSVSIENLGDATVDPRYRRAMDWDIPPTEYSEYVTIQGTANAENVLFASDDGFASGDPFAGPSELLFTGDAVDSGPGTTGRCSTSGSARSHPVR